MEGEYQRLKPECKCLRCLGCNELEDKSFRGRYGCELFRQAEKKAWCADEAVEKFMKTGKI